MVRFIFIFLLFCNVVFARDYIHIVGSSAVFPFVSAISEEFARSFRVKTPIVESTGTSSGFKLFCSGIGDGSADIAMASRKINDVEIALCRINSIEASDILEIKLGDDAIVIASAKGPRTFDFTKDDIFDALSFYIPKDDLNLVQNSYRYWSQIDRNLPEIEIKIYGPLRNTGTFDAVINMVLLDRCLAKQAFKMTYTGKDLHDVCSLVRNDGVYVEASSDENAVIQKTVANNGSFGLFSFSFLARNTDKVQAHRVNGVEANYTNISSGVYPISRPIYVYLKKPHVKTVKNLKSLLTEILSDDAIGEYGYLRNLGIVPISGQDLEELRSAVVQLQ